MKPGLCLMMVFLISCNSVPFRKISSNEEMISVPMKDASGQTLQLAARVCHPEVQGKARVVILNHGSPPNASDRPNLKPYACTDENVQWFLERGFLVVSPIRRGYGVTGGVWAESYGNCSDADFFHAGLETARDMDAVVEAVASLPAAQPDGMVVVGQSAGGWGTLAYNSVNHPRVSALINMAGGRGGHRDSLPNHNCSPERLVSAAKAYGGTSPTPMLWLYAANDSFFDPALARSLAEAFNSAGGVAKLIELPAYSSDGHRLFSGTGGSLI